MENEPATWRARQSSSGLQTLELFPSDILTVPWGACWGASVIIRLARLVGGGRKQTPRGPKDSGDEKTPTMEARLLAVLAARENRTDARTDVGSPEATLRFDAA